MADLRGVLRTIILVRGVMASSSSSKSMAQSAAEEVSFAPELGGCRGTWTILPPGISMLLMYLRNGPISHELISAHVSQGIHACGRQTKEQTVITRKENEEGGEGGDEAIRGFSLADLLIEKWLKNDDFIARLNESHECAQHA